MINSHAWRLAGAMAVLGCGGTKPATAPGSERVVLSKDQPPTGYVELRSLTSQSGKGCGVFGQSGSREDAEARLRNDAQQLGATYVRVTSEQAPGPNHQCTEHEYKVSGIAYRQASPVRAASAVPTPPAPTSAALPERVCVPGATQACLGSGACQGAQACRDDASGFLPCDCGPVSPNAEKPISARAASASFTSQ